VPRAVVSMSQGAPAWSRHPLAARNPCRKSLRHGPGHPPADGTHATGASGMTRPPRVTPHGILATRGGGTVDKSKPMQKWRPL